MRIALCLAGQPRFLRQGFENYRFSLLSHREVDVFCHAWHDPEREGQPFYVSSGWGGGTIESGVEETIAGLYQPKRLLVQRQVPFDTAGFHVDDNYQNPHLFANFSWPYALRQAARLCWDWELEQNFVYDRVILTRYDLSFGARVPVEELEPEKLHTLDTGLGLTYALCDQFFAGGSRVIKTVAELYPYMHRQFRTQNVFNTERNAYNLMIDRKIPMQLLSIPYHIMRS